MSLEAYGLKVGSQIDIQRSDGRVHAAVISGANEANKTVRVEWFENNETKGKEIELAAVVQLNELRQAPKKQASSPPQQRQAQQQQQQQQQKQQQPQQQKKQQQQQASSQQQQKKQQQQQSSSSSARASRPGSNYARRSIDNKAPSSRQGARSGVSSSPKPSSKAVGSPAGRVAPFSNPQRSYTNMSKADRKVALMIDECREELSPRPFDRNQPVFTDKITVCVRKRPLGRSELSKDEIDSVTMPDGQLTVIHESKEKVDLTKYIENHEFRFDYSFDASCNNSTVYKYTAQPLVRTIFDKGMATCFAYGQTGSGKTFTMGGAAGSKVEGIYSLACKDVFQINSRQPERNLRVSVSFFEIYGGKVFDLLNKQKRLRVLEDGANKVQVVGLAEKVVENINQVQQLLEIGFRARATGTTSANAASSRSHAVFQIILRTNDRHEKLHGKFSLIDLAGNERGADTMSADRRTRMEGAEINKSLLALKECIRALGRKGAHTPFRASKLTQVLRDSFISPRARTCMIAMISPGRRSCEHTLNTLRYADRVKELAPGKKRIAEEIVPEQFDDDDTADAGQQDPLDSSLGAKRDLQQLHMSMRSQGSNNKEIDVMFNIHEALAELTEAEELIIEQHRGTLQFEHEMMVEEDKLLSEVEGVDNDCEEYARRLDQILAAKIEKLTSLRGQLGHFRKQLQNEADRAKEFKGFKFNF